MRDLAAGGRKTDDGEQTGGFFYDVFWMMAISSGVGPGWTESILVYAYMHTY
jgi:hypothetical protein